MNSVDENYIFLAIIICSVCLIFLIFAIKYIQYRVCDRNQHQNSLYSRQSKPYFFRSSYALQLRSHFSDRDSIVSDMLPCHHWEDLGSPTIMSDVSGKSNGKSILK
eukprot:NODE_434_length_7483_cov_0.351165.p8 type:complete len:106 gc:universal NODE_434_length_7483_cov_0.351165:5847-5530(-)